ncbi:hypothetical protein OICFNHDK_3781 [Methylobacterium bullatum]|uniref:DUF551 domain-containing protein n=1 Tax=Methylobacterium bullatum TaxID=570505 RepID=A0AAV4ZB57_9HYPH|nr:hypothetical protein [Methylobacterium bullatum]GJD41298.1 hypothetical protein OICFNHDK_3781 [Methylobacterium bullatum]
MGWQSIDGAPRDGTWVLVRGGKPSWEEGYGDDPADPPPAVVAKWVPEREREFREPPDETREEYDDYLRTVGSWYFAAWDSALRSDYADPTEWMPLPE